MIRILIIAVAILFSTVNISAQEKSRERESWARLMSDCRTLNRALIEIGLVPAHEKALSELEKAVKSSDKVIAQAGLVRALELEAMTEIALVANKPCGLLGGNLRQQSNSLHIRGLISEQEFSDTLEKVVVPAEITTPILQGVLRRLRSATVIGEATRLIGQD